MNFIIEQYNQMADKFNLRGQRLVESIEKRIQFEKDALKGRIASEFAHDIESPLSAIRTIIALPQLDTEIARETLWVAITSISDMVSRLNFKSNSSTTPFPKVYSAAGVLEKVFKMKHVEFSGRDIYLKFNSFLAEFPLLGDECRP
jgi:signal transduction histidine kinase